MSTKLTTDMLNADIALSVILDRTPVLGAEKVKLLSALGRTNAADIVADIDLPPFANSSMDGFAVRSSDLSAATNATPVFLRVIGESSAGNIFGGTVVPGEAVRVMTGGVVPHGSDTVVPVEHVKELSGDQIQCERPAVPGSCVRTKGEDIHKGDIVLQAGEQIGPPHLGILAALGKVKILVGRTPTVNILSTGDELVEIDEEPAEGEIRNSSAFALAGYVTENGGVPRLLGIVRDRRKRMRKKIAEGMDADILLVTGGVSGGKYDFVKETLESVDVQIQFSKLNIKPGKPLVFGTKGKTLVFGLPGNPVSTAVTFLQCVRPALLKMQGRTELKPARHSALLESTVTKEDGKRHFLRGIARSVAGALRVRVTGIQSSGAMSSLSKANCLIIIPENVQHLHEGESVDIEFLQNPI